MMDWRLGREGFGLSLGLFLVLSLTFQKSWCLNSEGIYFSLLFILLRRRETGFSFDLVLVDWVWFDGVI